MRFVMVLALALLAGCTQPQKAKALLEANGYTDVQMQGYDFFGCSDDDHYHDAFTAKTQVGKTVNGTVCAGFFFKGATIRFR